MMIVTNWKSCLTALFVVLVLAWIAATWVFTAIGAVLLFLIKAVAWIAAVLVLVVLYAKAGDGTAPAGQRVGALLAGVIGTVICISIAVSGSNLAQGSRLEVSVAQVTASPRLLSVEALSQNLDALKDQPVLFTGTVVKATADGDYMDAVCTVNGSKDAVLASYKTGADTPKIAAGDLVAMWGLMQGTREYQAQGDEKRSLPAIAVGLVRHIGDWAKYAVTDASVDLGAWTWSVSQISYRGFEDDASGYVTFRAEMLASSPASGGMILGTRHLPVISAIDGVKCKEITPDSYASSVVGSNNPSQSGGSFCQPMYNSVPCPSKSITFKFYGISNNSVFAEPDQTQSKELTISLP